MAEPTAADLERAWVIADQTIASRACCDDLPACQTDAWKVYLADAIAHQFAAVRAEASAWQPIETVPRDGTTAFLGWLRRPNGNGVASVIIWMSGDWYTSLLVRAAPTHWMPLPPPPEDC